MKSLKKKFNLETKKKDHIKKDQKRPFKSCFSTTKGLKKTQIKKIKKIVLTVNFFEKRENTLVFTF